MRVAFDEQPSDQDLQHFGVKGMKWGVRNYTDKNGRLTAEGREHYAEKSLTKHQQKISAKWQARGLSKAVGATVARRVTTQIAEDNYIKNYLLDHPNTKLNRDGILKTRGLE